MISVVRDRADDNIMRNGARTRQTGAESLLFIFLLAVVLSTTNGKRTTIALFPWLLKLFTSDF